MNQKLKAAIRDRSSEQGFALPLAVGMGMIMILVGMTMVMRSQGDQITASAQKATARSLGTAETGVTRVQSLLSKYPLLATSTLVNIGSSSSSWQQVHSTNPTTACASAGGTSSEVSSYHLKDSVSEGWISLDSQSRFRVTRYVYEPKDNPKNPAQIIVGATIPAVGSVIVVLSPTVASSYLRNSHSVEGYIRGVRGTLSRNDILSGIGLGSLVPTYTFTRHFTGTGIPISLGDTFTPAGTPGEGTLEVEGQSDTATSHLRVEIPVMNRDINNFPVPGAWIATGGTGNNTIQGNVFLKDCGVSLSNVRVTGNHTTGQSYAASHTNLDFPDLPNRIVDPAPNVLGTINSIRLPLLGAQNLGDGNYKLTLPRGTDIAVNSVYRYAVTNIDLPNKSSIEITPGAKVTFYLNGNIVKGGDIVHECGTNASCKPTDFRIFGYGGSGSKICTNGNRYMEAFIFAPIYKVGVAEGGSSAGGFKGSVWTYEWSNGDECGSDNPNIVLLQAANWTDLDLIPKKLPLRIAPISSWQRKEAQ